MSDFNRDYPRPAQAGAATVAVDAGLRAFMLGVYNKVGLGLVLSAVLAYVTSSVPAVSSLMFQQVMTPRGMAVTYTLLGWIVAIAPLPILLFASFSRRQNPAMSGIVYWLIVSLFGASLGIWALLYTGQSIFETFLITAAAFGGLSLFGYTTKRDLGPLGSFLIVGLFGIIIATLVFAFIPAAASPGLLFAINVIGVLIFAGLIAFDTQRLKLTYHQLGGNEAALGVATNYGALSLYLDFLNLFLFLLRLMGQRR